MWKVFKSLKNLRDHETYSHNSNSKNHTCKLCDRSFMRKGFLKMHEKIHTGEKRFHCIACEKKFVTSWKLKKHMDLHIGKKTLCL